MITYEAEGLGYLVYDLKKITRDVNRSIFVHTDWDFPSLASTFGWSISGVQPEDDAKADITLQVLQVIDNFWSEGSAPIYKGALIGPSDKPIAQLVREAVACCNDCDHSGTDGTIACPDCGMTPTDFISAARDYLDDNTGATAEDPGYFGDES